MVGSTARQGYRAASRRRSTAGCRWRASYNDAVPGRPIPVLVARTRSAEGVHDQTGPESLGPCWVRMTSETPGPRWAPAVTTGRKKPQVAGPSRPRPLPMNPGGSAFESHPQLPRADGSCQQVRRRRDGPYPVVELVPTLPGPPTVVLAGRAHYRAIHNGFYRSPAENQGQHRSDLDLRRCLRRRSPPRPIWLCEPRVAGSNPGPPARTFGVGRGGRHCPKSEDFSHTFEESLAASSIRSVE
jgi:hypothetical protein